MIPTDQVIRHFLNIRGFQEPVDGFVIAILRKGFKLRESNAESSAPHQVRNELHILSCFVILVPVTFPGFQRV